MELGVIKLRSVSPLARIVQVLCIEVTRKKSRESRIMRSPVWLTRVMAFIPGIEGSGTRSRSTRKRCSGVTLIENVIAMGIIGVSTAGLYSSGILGVKNSVNQVDVVAARSMAMQKVEEIKSAGFDGILLQNPYENELIQIRPGYFVGRRVAIFGHDATGTIEDEITESDYLEVVVLVSYYSTASGSHLTDSFSTLINKD